MLKTLRFPTLRAHARRARNAELLVGSKNLYGGKIEKMVCFSREHLRRVLRKKAAVVIHLHTFTSADLHLHTLTSADLHLHTLTSADLHLHTLTSADLHLHTLTPADLHLHTFTPAGLHLHALTSADLHLHTLTPLDLHVHILTSAVSRAQPFRTKWTLDVKNCGKIAIIVSRAQPSFARNGRWTSKTAVNCDFDVSIATLSHEMDVGRQ